MAQKDRSADTPVTIKKYANRRLYNTASSSYVTLDDLCQMVKEGTEFVVYDAKTGEDITRSVLTQIIVEEESKGHNLLPISFLRQLISFYGDSLQGLVPRYLDYSMKTFARNQEQIREYMAGAFDGMFPFGPLEELGKQNMAMIERTMKMFSPFATGDRPDDGDKENSNSEANEQAAKVQSPKELDELRARIDALQEQLEKLTTKGDR